MRKLLIMGIGKDKPGIVRDVSEILYRAGASLEDSSMTILEGNFAMIMIASVPGKNRLQSFNSLFAALRKKLHLTIDVTELKEKPKVGPVLHQGKPFVVTVLGKDKPGIVYRVSSLLACYHVNITDLNTKVIGREGGKNVYAMVLEVEFPPKVSSALIEGKLKKLSRVLRTEILLRAIESITC